VDFAFSDHAATEVCSLAGLSIPAMSLGGTGLQACGKALQEIGFSR